MTHDHSSGGSHGHSMNVADTNAASNPQANGNSWSSANTVTLYANSNSVDLANQGFTTGNTAPGTNNSGTANTGSTTPGAGGSYGTGSDVLPKYLRVVYLMRVV